MTTPADRERLDHIREFWLGRIHLVEDADVVSDIKFLIGQLDAR